MKRIILPWLVCSIFIFAAVSNACVGRTLHLGVSNAANEMLLAELASRLIIERTGSSVQIDVYKDSAELYRAVKEGKVNLFFESRSRAFTVLGKSGDVAFAQIKSEYKSRLNLTWLALFGASTQYGPVLTVDTLATYPALPKLLNKLSAALENDTYPKLLKSVESEDKIKKVAREFLKGKKLI